MSTGNWNGNPLPSRRDTVASRCNDIVERGMRRLGLERAPACLNKILARDKVDRVPTDVSEIRRRKAALVEEWRGLPRAQQILRVLAKKHGLGHWPARHALEEAGLEIPRARKAAR